MSAYLDMTVNDVTAELRRRLKARGCKWVSVKHGTGTAYGWIDITAVPSRRDAYGSLTDADAMELARLLGIAPHMARNGVSIPASSDYRREYLDRAAGNVPTVRGEPYWD